MPIKSGSDEQMISAQKAIFHSQSVALASHTCPDVYMTDC